MKRAFAMSSIVVAVVLLTTGCRSGVDLSRPETQRQFGVRMAKMSLWREAMFRFQRAVEIEPQNAMAHNNLAVAYEAVGDFDAAASAYREALRLDRSNQYIQKNYSRYVEFTQRDKRREVRPPAVQAPAPEREAAEAAGSADAQEPAEPAAPSDESDQPAASEPSDVPVPDEPQPTPPTPAGDRTDGGDL